MILEPLSPNAGKTWNVVEHAQFKYTVLEHLLRIRSSGVVFYRTCAMIERNHVAVMGESEALLVVVGINTPSLRCERQWKRLR